MATKRKDASKYLGGASGKAAGALRGRGAQLDRMMDMAEGAPAKKKTPPAKSKKK